MSPPLGAFRGGKTQIFLDSGVGKGVGTPVFCKKSLQELPFMINKLLKLSCVILALFSLGGCSTVGSKAGAISSVYIATSISALLLLTAYWLMIKKKEPWFILLFSSILVVNIGYLALSLSTTLNEALLSNRISYLGSVFLPLSMFMVILKNCKLKLPRWGLGILLGVSIVVFLIAASPGYLDIYYKEVTLTTVNGATVLEKEYGPLHSIYLYYLVGYFCSMIGIIIYARAKKKLRTTTHAILLLSTVLINISVWLMEQLVDFDFEFLSVSYVVSEVFLLGISLLIQELTLQQALRGKGEESKVSRASKTLDNVPASSAPEDEISQKAQYMLETLSSLTPTEKKIYAMYVQGMNTKEVMAELTITENTLKYHNRNLYQKLGVSSRKELVEVSEYAKTLKV